MKGNEEDCICHKPDEKHVEYCDAYKLSEMLKRMAAIEWQNKEERK
jgi:hypothetical protein